ncbi:MAG: metallophosphoesterase [Myxococcota bacterium]
MTRATIAALPLLAALSLASPAGAFEITRGPFLQQPGPDRMMVVWEQDEASGAVIRYGETDAYGQELVVDEAATRHEVFVEGLEPGTRYHYGVYEGDEPRSEDASFSTAVDRDTPFRFVVFGDTRNRHDVHASVVDAIRAEEPLFAIQTGDLVADGEVQEQWDTYFEIEQPLMGQVPVFPVIGNHDEHEGQADLYVEHFALPEDTPGPEHYYSFDYGNVHVLVLDGYVYADPWPVCVQERDLWVDDCFHPAQQEWLEQDIRDAVADPDVDHVFVSIHIGPYSSKDGRSGNSQMRRLLPWLRGMGVTAIFSGHDHYYERGTSGNGIPYMITGGGGAPLYDVSDPNSAPHEVVYNESVENYIVVDVDGDEVSFTARTPEGRLLDEFSVTSGPECETDADCAGAEPPPDCEPPAFCSLARQCAFDCEMEGGGRSDIPRRELPPTPSEPDATADAGSVPDATADTSTGPGPDVDAPPVPEEEPGQEDPSSGGCDASGEGSDWPAGPAHVVLGLLGLAVARRRLDRTS